MFCEDKLENYDPYNDQGPMAVLCLLRFLFLKKTELA